MKTITVDGQSSKGYLTRLLFETLLLKKIKHIEFCNSGELFLNPDLESILNLAEENNIMVSCSSGVNLNTASPDMLKHLVQTKFQFLNITLDPTQKDYTTVICNINILNNYKRMYNSPYPKLQWQFIVTEENKHELRKARCISLSLDMRFKEVTEKPGRETCYQLWTSPKLSYDLSCVGCSHNIWKPFDKYTLDYAKQDLMGIVKERTDIPLPPCKSCDIYYNLMDSRIYLSKTEVLYHTVKTRMTTDAKYLLWRNDL